MGSLIASVKLILFGAPFENGYPVGYWSQSYFGGFVPALGGALLLGAADRLLRKQFSITNAVFLALGLSVLALSRPVEGFFAALPALILLFAAALRGAPFYRSRILFVPVIVVLALTTALQLSINFSVTGSAFVFPYQLHHKKYAAWPIFLFQKVGEAPRLANRQMTQFNDESMEIYRKEETAPGFLDYLLKSKCEAAWRFYFDAWLSIAFLCVFSAIRRAKLSMICSVVAIEFVVLSLEPFFMPHYAAPITSALYLLMTQCMRELKSITIGKNRIGAIVLNCTLLGFFLSSIYGISSERRFDAGAWFQARAQIMKELSQDKESKHIIFVRYGPDHYYHHEWVYNGADLHDASVIWVHEGNADQNKEVLQYYKNRKVWLLTEDSPAELRKRRKPSLQRIR